MKEQKTSNKSNTQWKLESKGRKRHTKSTKTKTNKQNETNKQSRHTVHGSNKTSEIECSPSFHRFAYPFRALQK
jgi:hypothetical protein